MARLWVGPRKQAFLVVAIAYLASARVELRSHRIRSILDRLCDRGPLRAKPRHDVDMDVLGWALRTAASLVPWRSDCLIQSMAADRWLRRKGILPDFRLGVTRGPDGQLLAHAWIEVNGRVLTGGAEVKDYNLMIST